MYTESPDHQDLGQSSLPAWEAAYHSSCIFTTQRSSSNPNISLIFPSSAMQYGCMIDELISYKFHFRAVSPASEIPNPWKPYNVDPRAL